MIKRQPIAWLASSELPAGLRLGAGLSPGPKLRPLRAAGRTSSNCGALAAMTTKRGSLAAAVRNHGAITEKASLGKTPEVEAFSAI